MSDFRLKVFECVAKNHSFTKAAQELCISQPAVTKHIRVLEDEYKVKLFNRSGSKIELTKAGSLLLQHAKLILSQYNRLEYALHKISNEHVGSLKLGASTTIAQYVIPKYLAKFNELFPKIELSLINDNCTTAIQGLLYESSLFASRTDSYRAHPDDLTAPPSCC